MTGRIALWLSFVAIGAIVTGLVLLGGKLTLISKRVAALERKLDSPPPAPPLPSREVTRPGPEAHQEQERRKVRQLAESENQAQFDDLVKRLGRLEPATEARMQAAFAEEFAFYADGVVRSFQALQVDDPKPEDNGVTTPEFRKGLEKRIAATDEKVRALLPSNIFFVYEQWRVDMRKDRYELD